MRLQVHLRHLLREGLLRELERVLEGPALHGVVDGRLEEPELREELRPRRPPQVQGVRVRHPLGGIDAPVELRDADGLLPLIVRPVHVHGGEPLPGPGVMLLGVAEVALHLELLGEVLVALA